MLVNRMFLQWSVILVGLQVLLSCNPPVRVDAADTHITISGGVYSYRGVPFTGEMELRAADIVRVSPYVAGMQQGRETTLHSNGRLLEERFYAEGEKTGIHRGWYPDGQYRFHQIFKTGKPIGDAWVWHANGQPYQYDRYDENGEQIAAKKWRKSGQIYYNLVFVGGRPVGLGGNTLCDPAKKIGDSE